MTLFRCRLQCKIKGVPDIIEYLRCTNEDKLITMFEKCENFEGAMYYGYKWTEILPMKINNFPEVKTMKIDCKTKQTERKPLTKKIEIDWDDKK